MTSTDNADKIPRPAARRRRLVWRLIGLFTLVLLVLLVGVWAYARHAANSRLRGAIAEADRLDSGWRLSEIEAKRAVVPDAENSAPRVQDAIAKLPGDWLKITPPRASGEPMGPLRGGNLLSSLLETDPETQLDARQLDGLRAELEDLAPVLAISRPVAELPRGRPELTYSRNVLNTPLPYAQGARQVARLLLIDAMLRAQEGDLDGALDSGRALMNVGRSLGDEPFLISQLVRISIGQVALASIQRTLAQGEPSDSALAKFEALLSEEAAEPILLTAMRGERAAIDDLFTKLSAGEVSPGEFESPPHSTRKHPVAGFAYMDSFLAYNHGVVLDLMNRAVEISKRPPHELPPLWKRWDESTNSQLGGLSSLAAKLTNFLIGQGTSFKGFCFHYSAELNVVRLMLALERFRLARGRWPDPSEVAELKPPPDPWVDGPIQVVGTEGGLVVYSLGADRADHGGRLHPRRRVAPGFDVGFRLWDLDRRRQPPEPKDQRESP